jgi:hypothetical protein
VEKLMRIRRDSTFGAPPDGVAQDRGPGLALDGA